VHVTLAPIAVFHFNRYRWTGKVLNRATRSGAKGKVNTKVNFPLKLAMSSLLHAAKCSTSTRYQLKAVVVHDGLTPASGHYYAYAFNDLDRCWYRFDDKQSPSKTDESKVLKANPFMLFYERM
jgi:ubiquitin carboxyl-terminal hydrolase 36/42